MDAYRFDGGRLYTLATAELKWVKAHKPWPCYQPLWQEYMNMWTDLQTAGKKIKSGSLDTTYIEKATGHSQNINEGGLFDDANAACDQDPAAQA